MAWGIYSWGSLDLLVKKGSYSRTTSVPINEIQLIPGPTNTEPASILQSGGRIRERAGFIGYATEAEYQTLKADYYASTERVFTDINGKTMTAIIESLSEGYMSGWQEYSISLLEV